MVIHKIYKAEPILGKRLVGLMATEVPEAGLHRLYLVMDDGSNLEIYNDHGFRMSYVSEGQGMEMLRQVESGPRSEIEWVDGTVTINHTWGRQSPPSIAPTPAPRVVPTPIAPPPPVLVPPETHLPVSEGGPASLPPPPETHSPPMHLDPWFWGAVMVCTTLAVMWLFGFCFTF